MKKNISASLEAKLKSSREMVAFVKDYDLYNPTSEELKLQNYETFVNLVDSDITPFKDAAAAFMQAREKINTEVDKMVKISINVRSEILEIKGKNSTEYRQTDNIVKLLTGENIQEHAKMKKEIIKNLKEGEPVPVFISVSMLDHKSRLGNFRSLIALVKTFGFYGPADEEFSITSLEAQEAAVSDAIAGSAQKESEFLAQRSKILRYFNEKGGLKDRAQRAKVHVKRKYGRKSPEYKALTKKKY